MTRETKVGLLVGMGVILLIGIIVSDHLSMAQKQTPPDMTDYAALAQNSLNANGTGMQALPASSTPSTPAAPAEPLPTPQEMPTTPPAMAYQPAPSPEAPLPASDQTSSPAAVAISRGTEAGSLALNHAPPIGVTPTFEEAALASRVPVVAATTPGPQPTIHYVQRGETLYAIANRYYSNGELWPVIAQNNRSVVKADNSVALGARLLIPNKALLPDLLKHNAQAASVLATAGPAAVTTSARPIATTATRTITVQPGDTLSGLASEHLGSSRKWSELLAANKDVLDKPQDLRVGMTLKVPAGSTSPAPAAASLPATTTPKAGAPSGVYTVQSGDTLSSIAQSRLGDNSRWKSIFDANRDQLKNANDLTAGMKLKIPASH